MTLDLSKLADECPGCRGRGYHCVISPQCCGKISKTGECRGYCAVPEEVQEPCSMCGGSGFIAVIIALAKEPKPR